MKIGYFRPLRLNPTKTVKVCDEITQRWPVDGSLPVCDDATERRRIRELIKNLLPGDGLYRRDAQIAAVMVMGGKEARSWRLHAVEVLAAMPTPLSFASLYQLYQHFYTHTNLRRTVSGLYVHLPAPKPFQETDALAVFAENPVASLQIAAFRSNLAVATLQDGFHLMRTAPLAIHTANECYRAAIANPTGIVEREWILAHSVADIIAAMETYLTTDATRGAFLVALVQAYNALSWKFMDVVSHSVFPRIFERITQKDLLGKPDERPHSWQIDKQVVALVHRWLNYLKIGDFFDRVDAEPARRLFWQRATPVIEDIHEYPLCRAFAMKIGTFWFVEFGETGNACYPYEATSYDTLRYWHERFRDCASLKNKTAIYIPQQWNWDDYPYSVGTMVHNPRWTQWDEGWHRKFEAYLETFCHVTLE